MPAGNDAKAAVAELADQFGEGAGTAEGLIDASAARYTQPLREAQMTKKDEVATADKFGEEEGDRDYSDVAKTSGVKKDLILDAAIRGKYVTYVYIDDAGRTHKGYFLREDLGKAPKTAEKNVESAESGDDSGSKS